MRGFGFHPLERVSGGGEEHPLPCLSRLTDVMVGFYRIVWLGVLFLGDFESLRVLCLSGPILDVS